MRMNSCGKRNMRLLREKRRWDPNARRPNCRGKGISTCRVMPGKMNLCSWQVTAGKGAVRLQDCTQLRILCMHCTQKMQPIIVRRDSSADVSRDPGCRSYLNPTPGIPRTASRFPAALQSMNMEQRTAHKKFNATILLSQAGDPGIFFGFGRRLFFLQAFSMFQIEKPVLAEPEKFGNRASIFILDTGEKSVVFE